MEQAVVDEKLRARQSAMAHSRQLRGEGLSWVEIARRIRVRHRVSALVAMRLAHAWTLRQVADEWNRRWPTDKRGFKNLSYWENWPSSTGYPPSLDTLVRLAEVYECAVVDMLEGVGDFRGLDGVGGEYHQ